MKNTPRAKNSLLAQARKKVAAGAARAHQEVHDNAQKAHAAAKDTVTNAYLAQNPLLVLGFNKVRQLHLQHEGEQRPIKTKTIFEQSASRSNICMDTLRKKYYWIEGELDDGYKLCSCSFDGRDRREVVPSHQIKDKAGLDIFPHYLAVDPVADVFFLTGHSVAGVRLLKLSPGSQSFEVIHSLELDQENTDKGQLVLNRRSLQVYWLRWLKDESVIWRLDYDGGGCTAVVREPKTGSSRYDLIRWPQIDEIREHLYYTSGSPSDTTGGGWRNRVRRVHLRDGRIEDVVAIASTDFSNVGVAVDFDREEVYFVHEGKQEWFVAPVDPKAEPIFSWFFQGINYTNRLWDFSFYSPARARKELKLDILAERKAAVHNKQESIARSRKEANENIIQPKLNEVKQAQDAANVERAEARKKARERITHRRAELTQAKAGKKRKIDAARADAAEDRKAALERKDQRIAEGHRQAKEIKAPAESKLKEAQSR